MTEKDTGPSAGVVPVKGGGPGGTITITLPFTPEVANWVADDISHFLCRYGLGHYDEINMAKELELVTKAFGSLTEALSHPNENIRF